MKKYILPIIAVVVVIIAAVVLIVVPKSGSTEQANDPKIDSAANTVAKASDDHVEILASQLSEDKISLFSVADDSKVELIAFATCQSCNGSPGAYYTQSGDLLQCNNCGLTCPLSVIGEDGSGCHPIMLDDTKVKEIDDVVSIDKAYLLSLESLFKNVAEH